MRPAMEAGINPVQAPVTHLHYFNITHINMKAIQNNMKHQWTRIFTYNIYMATYGIC